LLLKSQKTTTISISETKRRFRSLTLTKNVNLIQSDKNVHHAKTLTKTKEKQTLGHQWRQEHTCYSQRENTEYFFAWRKKVRKKNL